MINCKMFWGYKPRGDGSYCNINVDTGTINYVPSYLQTRGSVKPSSYPLTRAIQNWNNLDEEVKFTIKKLMKDPALFNKAIMAIDITSTKKQGIPK